MMDPYPLVLRKIRWDMKETLSITSILCHLMENPEVKHKISRHSSTLKILSLSSMRVRKESSTRFQLTSWVEDLGREMPWTWLDEMEWARRYPNTSTTRTYKARARGQLSQMDLKRTKTSDCLARIVIQVEASPKYIFIDVRKTSPNPKALSIARMNGHSMPS